MVTADLARLRELLERATPGEWHWDADRLKGTTQQRARICTSGKTITQSYHSDDTGKHDAELICAMKNSLPALLTELEQLRAELKHRCICRFTSGGNLKVELCKFHKRLVDAERDRYRDDAERYRWIVQQDQYIADYPARLKPINFYGVVRWETLDAAIDAAKEAK